MADNWDEEDFEPGEFKTKKGDQWEGEDEDDDGLKENWDDEDEEKNKEKTEVNEPSSDTKTVQVKKKKTFKQKVIEKEEQKKEDLLRKAKLKKELEENQKEEDDEESIFSSKNDELAEKLRKQKLVEEADLEVAKDTFGILSSEEGKKSIDSFNPTSREEFSELAKMIVEKLSQFETSVEYPGFLETLIRDLATGIDAEEVKKLGTVLNVLASEKQKAQKGTKGKRKGKKAVLGGGAKGNKGVDIEDYSTYGDEYDDFM